MCAKLPDNWTDEDQEDLDRGKSSWDDSQWFDEYSPTDSDFRGTVYL
jgi:hypothetical protein